MVNSLAPKSVWGSSQKPSLRWQYSMRREPRLSVMSQAFSSFPTVSVPYSVAARSRQTAKRLRQAGEKKKLKV